MKLEEKELQKRKDIYNKRSEKFKKEISNSSSKFIKQDFITSKITFEAIDVINGLKKIKSGRVLILNFASFYNIGGGFLKGSIAQEESLCEHSLLAQFLETRNNIYDERNKNRKEISYLYETEAILSYDVPFFLSKDPLKVTRTADVISIAAPNISNVTFTEKERKTYKRVFKDRVRFLFDVIYREEKYDHIILGAWGCGVFGNDPEFVAKIFAKEINRRKHDISNIHFFIPDKDIASIFSNTIMNVVFGDVIDSIFDL